MVARWPRCYIPPMAEENSTSSNFIETITAEHNTSGRFEGRVHTRFPPEPNGFLHIGHAKAICIDFGIAERHGGKCNLRFDDTNPVKEDTTYVDAIKEDIRWLGWDWEDREFYASDYFEQLYEWAVQLIKAGHAITMWYYAPTDPSGKEVKFADLAGIPTFTESYRKLRGGDPSGIKFEALTLVNNLSAFMLRGSFVPAGTPKAAVDALRAAWRELPGDAEFVGDYKKAFKADPKILQAETAQAHIDRVKSIDPKVVAFLKGFIKSGK